jgi:hypothetical protein
LWNFKKIFYFLFFFFGCCCWKEQHQMEPKETKSKMPNAISL